MISNRHPVEVGRPSVSRGLAPYFFDIDAAAFIGESGRVALRFEAEYELLFTQRLILTPDIEINLYGQNDPDVGISDLDEERAERLEERRRQVQLARSRGEAHVGAVLPPSKTASR